MLELHTLPGRIRVKNNNLYHDKALSRYIAVYCESLYGVSHCCANERTATVLIVYDQEKTDPDQILDSLDHAIAYALNHDRKELKTDDAYVAVIEKRNKARIWFLIYGITYLLFKVKQAMYGKFSFSRSVSVLEVASLLTIIGGYPLLKSIYIKSTKRILIDPDLLLKLASVSLTLLRESAKGVFVLALNALNDYLRYAADAECLRAIRQSLVYSSGAPYLLTDGEMGGKADISKGEISIYREISEYSRIATYASMGLAAASYLLTRNVLNAMSVMLVLSPAASGTAFSSGIKNHVSMLCRNKVHARNPHTFEKLANVKSQSGILVGGGIDDIPAMDAADVSVSLINAANGDIRYHSDYIILKDHARDLPDLISLSAKSSRRIKQSVSASKAFNALSGLLAFCQCFDPFTAKSLNTVNSIMVLLMNQRIHFLSPERSSEYK